MMTKTYLTKEKLKLKHILGTYLKTGRYLSYEDALYDVLKYMEEKNLASVSSSSINYALKVKVDAEYIDSLMQWATSSSYFEAAATEKKKTYTLIKSPFK